jgi:hypothetical protein
MKYFTRVKLAVIGAVMAAVFLAGSAWAQSANDVAQIINTYFETTAASVLGNTITVTGSVNKPAVSYNPVNDEFSNILDLGDITGLVIDWKANLTVNSGTGPGVDKGMINFTSGTFNMTDGIIKIESPGWVDTIITGEGTAVASISGGTVTTDRPSITGFRLEEGSMSVAGGNINIPRGVVAHAENLTVSNPDALRGAAIAGTVHPVHDVTVTIYGHAISSPQNNLFPGDDDNYEGESDGTIDYAVPNGSIWDIEGVTSDMTNLPVEDFITITVKNGGEMNLKNTDMKFNGTFNVEQGGELNIGTAMGDTSRLTNVGGTETNDGTINIYGTLTNKDKVVNGPTGIINVIGGHTFDNQGTLINKGTITNKATGKITNTGKIANSGTINNTEGGTFQSVQTASEMGGTVNGEVQPLNSNSSGGGCDAGLGLLGVFGALALAAATRRRGRK